MSKIAEQYNNRDLDSRSTISSTSQHQVLQLHVFRESLHYSLSCQTYRADSSEIIQNDQDHRPRFPQYQAGVHLQGLGRLVVTRNLFSMSSLIMSPFRTGNVAIKEVRDFALSDKEPGTLVYRVSVANDDPNKIEVFEEVSPGSSSCRVRRGLIPLAYDGSMKTQPLLRLIWTENLSRGCLLRAKIGSLVPPASVNLPRSNSGKGSCLYDVDNENA
jgi:hypothetical protein